MNLPPGVRPWETGYDEEGSRIRESIEDCLRSVGFRRIHSETIEEIFRSLGLNPTIYDIEFAVDMWLEKNYQEEEDE